MPHHDELELARVYRRFEDGASDEIRVRVNLIADAIRIAEDTANYHLDEHGEVVYSKFLGWVRD